MAQTYISVDTGSTVNLMTYTVSEGSTTVNIPASVIHNSAGTEMGTNTNPFVVALSGGTLGVVTVTGSTTIASMPSITGSVAVVNTPTITGSVAVVNTPTVTGSVAVVNTPTITGSVAVVNQITGSTSALGQFNTTQSTTAAGSVSVLQMTARGALYVATGADSFTITGSTTIASMPSITGSVAVANAVSVGVTSMVATSVGVTSCVAVSVGVTSLPAVTGSVAVVNTPTITGSVSVLSSPAVTGSVAVVNTPTVTGSVSVINTVTVTGNTTQVNIQYPSSSCVAFTVSAAATTILVPSTAANSIYITDCVISNANTAGSILLGYATGSTAPTTTAIKIGPLYFAANGGCVWPIQNPIKLPASTNFVCTAASAGTMTATITYYVSA